MGKAPFFAILTDTKYVCPPIGPLNNAHHGADSTAILPGHMRNRFPCVCHSEVDERLIWNQLSRNQLISTQSILPRLFSVVLSPQIALLSHLLLPKLSILVDCCLGWVAQHLQAFCMLLATHCHHIVVVPLLLSNCHCPIAVLKFRHRCHINIVTVLTVVVALSPSLPLLSLPLLSLSLPSPSLPSSSAFFDDVTSSSLLSLSFLVANQRSRTKPLLPKLSISWLLPWMGGIALASILHVSATHRHHVVVVPLLLSNHHHSIAVLELRLLCHWHCCGRPPRRWHHCHHCRCCCCHLHHCHCGHHPQGCFVNVALSTLSKWGGGKFPWYLSHLFLCRKFCGAACGLWKQVFLVIMIPLTNG